MCYSGRGKPKVKPPGTFYVGDELTVNQEKKVAKMVQ
jgi:hypothetical protein